MSLPLSSRRARLLLKNASQVVTVGGGSQPKLGAAMNQVSVLEHHSLLVDHAGLVAQLVPGGAPTEALHARLLKEEARGEGGGVARVVDCTGKVVLPGFIDGHTHAVFAGDRSHEHALKLAGATYEDVHAAGGGIGFTVRATRAASEDQLLRLTLQRLDAMMRGGTTTCEIKTGYGLEWATELKMLRVANRAAAAHRMSVKTTFLVHAVPQGMSSAEVAAAVCAEQLPELRRLADLGEVSLDFVDVFCERGFFSRDDTRRVLTTAQALGFGTCFHGDELTDLGCGELAAELGVSSVSHLEMLSAAGVVAMARAGVHAQLLPTTAHLLRLPSPPARALVDAGAPVCLATDFNPNAHCLDLPTAMGLACVHFKLSMAEALVAATLNAASALGVAASHGSLEVGKQGDCVLLDAPTWEHVVYQMRAPVEDVFKGGVSVQIEGTRRPQIVNTATAPTPASTPVNNSANIKKGDSVSSMDLSVDLSSLAHGLLLALPPKSFATLDHSVPHAPRRPVTLSPALRRRALTNALRYFPPRHHAELCLEFNQELNAYGHIYMHRFRPRDHAIQAHPIGAYPAACAAGAALMLMVQNNLDASVAQFPHELITYGGNGSAFSNWAQYRLTMQHLSAMTDHQTLCLHSGHPMGLFPSHPNAPRLVVTNGMVVPNYSSRADYEEMYCAGVSQYGQMTAGSFCYIGPQGIVHGTTLTLLNAGRKYLGTADSLQGKLFVTAGLGGMSGAQAKAAVIAGGVAIVAEVDENAVAKRHRQGWVLARTSDLDECLAWARAALAQGRATSIAYRGNVVDLWERLASDAATHNQDLPTAGQTASCLVPELGSDQTSCHNPFGGGYIPVGLEFEEAQALLAQDPLRFKALVEASLRRHITAINALSAHKAEDGGGFHFFDYGNSFLLEASRAGADVLWPTVEEGSDITRSAELSKPDEAAKDRDLRFRYPSYVQDIMGDIFSLGFGPFRWVCTSADPADLRTTDTIAFQVLTALKEEYLAEIAGAEVDAAAATGEEVGATGQSSGSLSYAARAVPQLNDNLLWIAAAEGHRLVVGSQARILYANAAARARIAAAFNAAVASGALKAPVMLSRDHHDVSGTDAPWRETSNVADGSKFTADMAIHNVIGDAARGATSVSIHNGGGTGWGEAINGGFLLLLDGSPAAGRRAESMLHWDVFNGVSRRAWAGNSNALAYTLAEQKTNGKYAVQFPHKVSDAVLNAVMGLEK